MSVLVKVLLVLFLAVSLALIAHNEPGYILINYGPWKLETTLTLAVLTLILGFVALYFLLRFLINAWLLPRRVRAWQQERQLHKARNALTRGLLQMEEGRWQSAEQSLAQSAPTSDTPLLHYLLAARAAQKQSAYERRDNYLRLAHQSTPGADVAIGLTQAELQLSHHQTEQALASLQHVSALAPKHSYAAKLLMKLHIELHDWGQLLTLLPELRKRKILTDTEADELQIRAHVGQIGLVPPAQDLQALHELWDHIPKRLRMSAPILVSYSEQLHKHGEDLQAEALMREALKRQWNDKLIYLYGLVEGPDSAKQLAFAEGYLKQHSKNPVLLLTLGRLCLRNRLWGKGRAYFESSTGISPRTETYQELGDLLEQMNEPEAALEYYRKGLRMLSTPTTPTINRSGKSASPKVIKELSAATRGNRQI